MDNILLATFITGLTAGGLSCFAVQGGLLTGSIAQVAQIQNGQSVGRPLALATLLFLMAKIAIYTLLGFVLGLVGSVLSLSPLVKGLLQIGVGLFLLGNALRMFDVHPIFRYFTFEPPASWTRFIRRASKGNDRLTTPLFLGLLTVLIPCGVTQSAMALAVGTGSPWMGAAILFAFTLGTSPTFFGVTVLAGGLAKIFQKYFYPAVALVVLLLGFYTIDTGLNVMGSPVSSAALLEKISPPRAQAAPSVLSNPLATPLPAAGSAAANELRINVLNTGYSPNQLKAPAGQAIRLVLVTQNVLSCSRAFTIPAINLSKNLPVTGETTLNIPAQLAGTSLRFSCSMGMYTGVIRFE